MYAYVDSIIINGMTLQMYDKNLAKFHERAKLYNLTFNEKKSVSSTKVINYLGYTITHSLLKTSAERLRPFEELQIPKDKTTLCQVISLFSYYSKWILKFSDKIRLQVIKETFPSNQESYKVFNDFKREIEKELCIPLMNQYPL